MIKCPECGSTEIKVRKTVSNCPLVESIIRERICKKCGKAFITYEQIAYNSDATTGRMILNTARINPKKNH